MQDSVSRLDEATHTAATAEAGFLGALTAADCESQFYRQAFAYSMAGAGVFSIAHYCTPTIITPDQVATRNAMMNALVLYADKMSALASSVDDKQLGDSSQKMAASLRKLVESGRLGLPTDAPNIVAGVAAAFTAIADLAVDKQRFKGVTAAAKAMQPHIDALVDALQHENAAFAQTVKAGDKVLEAELRAGVSKAGTPDGKFTAILQARQILLATSGSNLQSIGTLDWDALDLAKPIADALPGIQRANSALALGTPANVASAAHDLSARATAARELYSAITTAK
jgi:hypothetical protein